VADEEVRVLDVLPEEVPNVCLRRIGIFDKVCPDLDM
jgi:hypothetical protein